MKNDGKMSNGCKFLFVISYIFCFVIEYFCGTLISKNIIPFIFLNLIGAAVITYILVIIFAFMQHLDGK